MMIKNKDKLIDTVYLILLCIIIVLLNLFIGSNHQEPKSILETLILLIGLTYLIIKTIKKEKNIIIKGKIDVFVLLFIIATFIPLIIKSYYSLNDTINFALEYLCVYVIYILARNVLKTKKDVNILIDVTLISSIVIIIFGLDKLYFNIFKQFLDFIDSAKSNAYGMISTFGYSNPLASYMSLLLFLALGRYLCVENKWIKALFSSYIQIAMIGFVFGNSRALMVMLPIIFIIYLIILKDNQKRLQSIAIIGGNLIIAYIFQAICKKLITTNLMLWLAFILDLIFVYLLSLILNKIVNRVKVKINKKKILIISAIIVVLLVIYCIAVKNIGEPVTIGMQDDFIELLGLKNNENYNIKINLSANIKNENLNNVEENSQTTLQIIHYSSQRKSEKLEEVVLQNGEQNLEFNLQAKEDFDRFRIYVKGFENKQYNVTINNIYINNKEYIVKYKYLPNDVIRMLRTLNPRTVSIYERIAFCEDSLRLAKNHLIFGTGGCTFANHIKPYQTYVHGYNEESHSYIIDLLLNYGMVGLLLYIFILIITILNIRKMIINDRKESNSNLALYISVFFGIAIFTLHSVMDYDLNYLVTICIYYMFIAILNKDDKLEYTKKSNLQHESILNCVIIIALISCLTLTVQRCYSDYLLEQKDYQEAYKYCKYSRKIKLEIIKESRRTNDIDTLGKFLELYIKDEKYKNNFMICNYLNYTISYYLDKTEYEGALKYIEILYKYIVENDNFSRVDTYDIYSKNRIISQVLNNIENSNAIEDKQILEWYNKFKEI